MNAQTVLGAFLAVGCFCAAIVWRVRRQAARVEDELRLQLAEAERRARDAESGLLREKRARRDAEAARADADKARADAEKARVGAETAGAAAEAERAQTALFFSAASHDLRQPLHALGLYSGLLLKAPDEVQRRSLIASVESCVDSLERLFNGILGIAEAEVLRTQIEPTAVPLMPLLEKVATRFRAAAEAKGLALRVAQTSLWANTDPGALERILSNLVANAVRYTARGRVVIGVRRRGDRCVLLVGDTGVGIAHRHQRKIFEAFYQTGNPERDRSRGFGLGLAIVERLCRAVGAQVEIASVVGRGTLFSVALARTEAMPESSAISSDFGGPPSSLRVLLVEDDPLVRDATVRTLQGWNIHVEACATTAEALARLAARPLDRWHVLVDARLAGGSDGLSLVDSLRAESQRPVAVSIITGEADAELVAAAASRGLPLLVKPLKPIRLRALLSSSR